MDWKIKALHALGFSQKLDQGQIDRAVEALVSDSLLYRRGVAFLLREPLAEIVTTALSEGERRGLKLRIANVSRIPLAPEPEESPKVIWELFQGTQTGDWILAAECGSTRLYWNAPAMQVNRSVSEADMEGHLATVKIGDQLPPQKILRDAAKKWREKVGL
jgi:hypothetical protein